MTVNYYNENDLYCAAWLRNLIDAGHIAPGVVDTRSIVDVRPDDIKHFTQCHFFAGIGGWSYAARLAGWPDDRPLWTGSCPCQPFSVAGKGEGQADARHLWPEFYRLIAAQRPAVVMGEQVAAAVGKSWLDGVCVDLESIGYTTGAVVVPASAVDAPHRRDRLWFVADRMHTERGPLAQGRSNVKHRNDAGRKETSSGFAMGGAVTLADSDSEGSPLLHGESRDARPQQSAVVGTGRRSFWHDSELVTGADGKARRVKPGIRLLAHGIPARVGKLRAFGNAIVPQVAAEIIGAYLECRP